MDGLIISLLSGPRPKVIVFCETLGSVALQLCARQGDKDMSTEKDPNWIIYGRRREKDFAQDMRIALETRVRAVTSVRTKSSGSSTNWSEIWSLEMSAGSFLQLINHHCLHSLCPEVTHGQVYAIAMGHIKHFLPLSPVWWMEISRCTGKVLI